MLVLGKWICSCSWLWNNLLLMLVLLSDRRDVIASCEEEALKED